MQTRPVIALACLLAGCIPAVRPVQPPPDVEERRKAEAGACWNGSLPPWLDDAALARVALLDRSEAQAVSANDSFRGGTFSSQPPPSPPRGSRVAAVMDERRAFQQWCALLRSGGKRIGP